MVQIPSWLHSKFKELSNEYSHGQIRVKMKKLWPRQVREEKQLLSRKCVATGNGVVTGKGVAIGNGVATKKWCLDRKLCRDQKTYVVTKNAAET